MFVEAARLAYKGRLSLQAFHVPDGRGARPGDQYFPGTGKNRLGKIDQLLPFGGDSQAAYHDIAIAFQQRGNELAAGQRNKNTVYAISIFASLPSPSSSTLTCRISILRILPVTVIGKDSVNLMYRGIL